MKKLPIFLILSLIFVIFFAKYIPLHIKSFLYTISLTIQNVLIFLVPIIIVIFIFRSISLLEDKGLKPIFLFALLIYLSNFIASFISFNLSFHFQDSLKLAENIKEMKQLSLSNTLTPLWNFNIPQIISNKIALLLGVLSGVFAPYALPKERVRLIAEKMFATTMNLIHRIFIPIIPIFILGFLLKLEQDNVFGLIMTNHFYVIRNTIIFGIIYILFIYLISSKFNLKKFCNSIYNMLPAAITAFISMSSTAALPYTIEGVEKNTNGGSKIVTSLVPSITNMHLLGDCFLMPACIYIVSKLFNHQITYLEFSLFLAYFALMKFTVITIPGGGILTIMPLLQSQLGFTPEMLSLVTAIYFLLDPFLAFMNVLGNGGFSLILNKLSRNYSAKDGRNHL